MTDSKQPHSESDFEQHIPEATPEWLRNLLFKYGLDEGILEGVPTPSSLTGVSSSDASFSQATTDISGILKQMADTLPHGVSRSEWKKNQQRPSETSNSAMEELLASLKETVPSAESEPETPVESEKQTPETLDWLDESLAGEMPDVPVFSEPDATTSNDWLADLPTSTDDASDVTDDIPEWLLDFSGGGTGELTEPTTAEVPTKDEPATPTPEKAPEEDEFSWMDDMLPDGAPASGTSTVEPATTISDETGFGEKEMPSDLEEWDAEWLARVAAEYPVDPTAQLETEMSDDAEPPLTEPKTIDTGALVGDLPQIMTEEPSAAIPPLAEKQDPDAVDVPDWLNDLPSEPEEPSADNSDWLSDLRGAVDVPETADTAEVLFDDSGSAIDVPDWLNDLPVESEPDTESSDNWMTMISETAEEITPEAVDDILFVDEPTELSAEVPSETTYEMPGDESAETVVPEVEEKPALADVSDWLKDISTEQPTSVDGIPDWLSEVQDSSETLEAESTEALFEDISPEAEKPDEPEAADGIPDWLSEVQGRSETLEAESTEALFEDISPHDSEATNFDWMDDLHIAGETDEPAARPLSAESSDEDAESETISEATETPDWLDALRDTSEDVITEGASEPLFEDAPELLPSESDFEAIPESTPEDLFDGESESDLGWTFNDDFSMEETAVGDTETASDLTVPDWMQSLDLDAPDDFSLDLLDDTVVAIENEEISIDMPAEQEETFPGEAASSDEPTDTLVDELSALAESSASSETKATSETQQTIEDEAFSVLRRSSPTSSSGATFNASTGIDAAREFYDIVTPSPLFPEMPAPSKPRALLGRLVQVILSLLFIIAITIPLFSHFDRGGFPFPWLEPSPAEQEAIRGELQAVVGSQLPDAVAIVSFDYTPATEGEMTPLAEAIVKQLLGQGMRVIAVSLEPEGVGMANAVFDTVASEKYGTRLINAGYLPGGPIAIRNLKTPGSLANLRDTKSGAKLATLAAWSSIKNLDTVGLIATVSANADTARWWVEQTTAVGDATPSFARLAVVSAAVEPFMRPYRDANQYHALVVGVNGAAALESARPQKNLGAATAMLDSQSVAHLVVMILLLLGTIAGLISKYGQESE